MTKKTKVDDEHREWRKLNDGILGLIADRRYEELYGEVEDKHLTWFGWRFRGGERKCAEERAFMRGWMEALRYVRIRRATVEVESRRVKK